MKFSTSALVAVVATAAFASKTNAQECGPVSMFDWVGTENNFGFVNSAPLAGQSPGDLASLMSNGFNFANPDFLRCGRTDCGDPGVDCGPGDFFALPCQDPDDGITDRSLQNQNLYTYTHLFDMNAAPIKLKDNEKCSMVSACITTVTFAEGQNANNGEAVGVGLSGAVKLDNQPVGQLADGDTTDLNADNGGQVSVQTTSGLCANLGTDSDSNPLTDGMLDVGINVEYIGDHWALDYSKLEIKFDCGPCPSSESAGDPHFKTFSGDWFDFHGGCDLVLIDVPDYDNQVGLAVNIRTTVRYAYSFIETIAIQVGEDILQVSGWGDYLLNGISNADMEGATMNGLSVTREVISEKQSKFVINLKNGHHFTIKVYKDLISTSFDLPEEHDVRGILGDRKGAKVARDGITVMEDVNEFGQEWQVQDTDHQLFAAVREPQFPTKCIMPDPVEREQRRLSATISQEAAEAACSHIKDEHVRDMCIFDVISVDDLSLAAGAY